MKLCTKEQQKSYENAKSCYICKRKIEDKHVTYATWHLKKYSIPKEISMIFTMDLTMIIMLL